MKKLLSANLSREEFLTWTGSGDHRPPGKTFSGLSKIALKSGRVALFWERSEVVDDLQPIIVVPAEELRDFFAFVGTYISTYRPYSAFFKVVPAEMISAVAESARPAVDVVRLVGRMAAGSALAEVFLQTNGRVLNGGSQISAVRATLTASLAQAVVMGYRTALFDWLAYQWFGIHRGAFSSPEKSERDPTATIWKLISAAVKDERPELPLSYVDSEHAIARFLSDAIHGHGIGSALSTLAASMSFEVNPAKVLGLSREERIKVFNDFVARMNLSGRDDLATQFLAGLLLAVTGNGSFDLLRSSRELVNRSPVSIVWFGVCAALFEDSNVLTVANCAGRRFVRDLQRPYDFFAPPVSDVNAFEYAMLRSDGIALDQTNSQSDSGFEIEILPGVTTYLSKDNGGRDATMAEEIEVLSGTLQEIRFVVDRAQRRLGYTKPSKQSEIPRLNDKPRGRSR